ncbi:hypothetical protein [Marinitoga aeolica]|uniref:Uncharacterized protein n=1 Tax=Marinitoga aeolica TaxID=2809031 RepID=A0ABY8PTI5_9BACT|nr:hypothetical protein [Marinitoga aeolica]WGS65938.1 hypothetical protein JRV97_05160 [Marinitoga aeolica]
MKKILLFTLLTISILFLLDIIFINTSTNKDLKTLKIKNTDTQIKDILNINTNNSQEEIKTKTWFKIITDGKSLIFKDVIFINDQIYIFGQNEKINKNLFILNMDNKGNILFQKEIRIPSTTKINKVEYIYNNFYIVGTQDYKPVIYIIDKSGEMLKSKIFEKNGEFLKIIKDDYDSIYIVGYIIEKSKKTGYFLEINKNLEKLNDYKITWYNNEFLTDIVTDRDYIYLLGNTNSTANNNNDIFLVKLNKLNYNDYSISKFGKEQLNEYGYSLLKEDKNFYIIGYSTTFNNFPWKILTIKTDNKFNTIWRKDYLLKRSSRGFSANILNNRIIISGYALERNDDFDGFIALLNKIDGILLKENYYGKDYDERILNSKLINNSVIISVGYQKKKDVISGVVLYTDTNGRLNGFMK